MANKTIKTNWSPTQGGSYDAYKPEYCVGDKWKPIPIEHGGGFPFPEFLGGVSQQIGLCGYEQSKAIAWAFAAHVAGTGRKVPKIRVVEYEVKYDIKARKIGPEKG